MPELPEVESAVRRLRPKVVGRRIEAVRVLWPRTIDRPVPSRFREELLGARIRGLSRRGKFLVFDLSRGCLLVHLRMSGRLQALPAADGCIKHTRLALVLSGGVQLRFDDPRKFGRCYLVAGANEVMDALGLEPLEKEFNARRLRALFSARPGAIKPLLLNQKLIAGIGNIYADESLWASRIHPLRSASSLTAEEICALQRAVRRILLRAIAREGTDAGDGVVRGDYQPRVYGRAGKPCRRAKRRLKSSSSASAVRTYVLIVSLFDLRELRRSEAARFLRIAGPARCAWSRSFSTLEERRSFDLNCSILFCIPFSPSAISIQDKIQPARGSRHRAGTKGLSGARMVEGASNGELIFWTCAIVGTLFFTLRLVLFLMAGFGDHDAAGAHDASGAHEGGGAAGHDADHGVASHTGTDVPFKLISVNTLSAFIGMFGWVGLGCTKELRWGIMPSFGAAFAAGFLTMALTAWIFKLILSLACDGDLFQSDAAVGKVADVYQRIPPGGRGRVQVTVNGMLRELNAISEDKEEIKSFTKVIVDKTIDSSTVSVKRL